MDEKERGPHREYRTDQIAVQWEPAFCIHTANCIRSLPDVFRPQDRPWVHLDVASADAIAAAVLRCPTGALHFRRLDGGPQERTPAETTVRVVANGPLVLRGDIEIRAGDGETIRRDTRVTLCRCGRSSNKPFCDNTHRLIGFQAP
ncbi:MAG: CDGSH iron-sulfur domain-containing protein [Dehalococcoidia bacterium]